MAHAEALILYKYDACIQKKWDKQGERERVKKKKMTESTEYIMHV